MTLINPRTLYYNVQCTVHTLELSKLLGTVVKAQNKKDFRIFSLFPPRSFISAGYSYTALLISSPILSQVMHETRGPDVNSFDIYFILSSELWPTNHQFTEGALQERTLLLSQSLCTAYLLGRCRSRRLHGSQFGFSTI